MESSDRNALYKDTNNIMTSPTPLSPLPEGLKSHFPDRIITRRNRTTSMSERIESEIREGTVRFFCRSKGHGFIDPDGDGDSNPLFVHITDIDGEFVPRKGDRVKFRMCPMPPRFDRFQAVHAVIKDFTPEVHHKWSEKETAQELEEDKAAMEEERHIKDQIQAKAENALYNSIDE